ncbi:outer membrane beta-barrel protein [Sphingobium sp. JS3065]|uniref:outer membrane beta-barrel protein n=1 Tax=Sphingobium sp. JS3065 TaxID=2970925 RepID=UPI0022641E82|nr:outer membrane beta-barrel protein [Sphingobium sp. JS3065]UZW56599.1 outer membrane beta-barrel protein [Sphingobium sp. JS3065]
MTFRFCSSIVAIGAAILPAIAMAQSTIDTVVPIIYDRGRNVSVTERARPETNPVGLPAGGFTIFPALDIQPGYSDNVYQTQDNRLGDFFVSAAPRVLARSNWSRNSLQVEGSGNLVRYATEKPRDQNGWQVAARGRYDAGSSLTFNLGVDTARLFESQFSGAAITDVRSPTPYQRSQARFLTDARFARFRVVASGTYADYDFRSVDTLAGASLSQDNRDRRIASGAVQLEYGVTPDTGIFGQVTYTDTEYDEVLAPGVDNRDSKEYRLLGGVTLDIAALVRGTFGMGYIDRQFNSALYRDVKGFSFDGRIEYFLSELTTITLTGSREIQDASASGSGFFTTMGAVRADHELLRNLLLNASASLSEDKFFGFDGKARVTRLSGGATYLTNRLISAKLDLSYARRKSDFATGNGPTLSEFRMLAGISVHP